MRARGRPAGACPLLVASACCLRGAVGWHPAANAVPAVGLWADDEGGAAAAARGAGAARQQEFSGPGYVHRSAAWEVRRVGRLLASRWRNAVALGLATSAGAWAFHAGSPKGNREEWKPQERAWLAAAAAQLLVISASSALALVEFPVRAPTWGLHLWQTGLVLGALPLGHLLALPLYPRMATGLSAAKLCGLSAVVRALMLVAFAHQRSFGVLLACRLATGATCGIAHSAALAFLNQRWPRPGELTDFLAHEGCAVSFGAMLGCATGAILLLHGYATPFWAAAALNLACGLLAAHAFQLPPQEGDKLQPSLLDISDCLLRRKGNAPDVETPVSCAGEGASQTGGTTRAPANDAVAVSWHTALGIGGAALSLCCSTALATSWEPILSQYLRARDPKAFATPLELGAAWTAWYAFQVLLALVGGRWATSAACGFGRVRGVGAEVSWLITCGGWALLVSAFGLVAVPNGGWPTFVTGLTLSAVGAATVWSLSMPCLLQASRPLGRAAVEKLVPEVWVGASCLGEVAGPVIAALAVGGKLAITRVAEVQAASQLAAISSAALLAALAAAVLLSCRRPAAAAAAAKRLAAGSRWQAAG